MIPGIEILAQETVQTNMGSAMFGIILGGILVVVIIILGIVAIYDNEAILLIPCSLGLVLAVLTLGIGISELNQKPYTEYKVLISDEVSWNEFNEKYEVIEQDGKIYTIKEK